MKTTSGNHVQKKPAKILTSGLAIGLCTVIFSVGCAVVTADPFALSNVNDRIDNYHERMVKDDKRAMARSVRRLLLLASEGLYAADERHERVLRELEILEGIAEVINEDSEIYSYSVSSPYMGSFLHDISMAREFAESDPPDYQPATGLVNSCRFCHQNSSSL